MESHDRAPLANFLLFLVLAGGGIAAWFLLASAPWYAHVGVVVAIVIVAWLLVERVLSAVVNRLLEPEDPKR